MSSRLSRPIQRAAHAAGATVEDVGVDHRGGHVLVVQLLLHRPDAIAGLDEVRDKRMSQRVAGRRLAVTAAPHRASPHAAARFHPGDAGACRRCADRCCACRPGTRTATSTSRAAHGYLRASASGRRVAEVAEAATRNSFLKRISLPPPRPAHAMHFNASRHRAGLDIAALAVTHGDLAVRPFPAAGACHGPE